MSTYSDADRNEAALRLAIFGLKKIADDKSQDGQMISAYRMLAQVALSQINDVLNSDDEVTAVALITRDCEKIGMKEG